MKLKQAMAAVRKARKEADDVRDEKEKLDNQLRKMSAKSSEKWQLLQKKITPIILHFIQGQTWIPDTHKHAGTSEKSFTCTLDKLPSELKELAEMYAHPFWHDIPVLEEASEKLVGRVYFRIDRLDRKAVLKVGIHPTMVGGKLRPFVEVTRRIKLKTGGDERAEELLARIERFRHAKDVLQNKIKHAKRELAMIEKIETAAKSPKKKGK